MDLLAQVTIRGNIICGFCGKGDECEMSTYKSDLVPPGTKACDEKYVKVEGQKEVWNEAMQIGSLMGERIKQ